MATFLVNPQNSEWVFPTVSMDVMHDPLHVCSATPLAGGAYLHGIGENSKNTIQVRDERNPGELANCVLMEPGKQVSIPAELLSPDSPLNELWGICEAPVWGLVEDSAKMIPLLKLHTDPEGNPAMYVSCYVRLPGKSDE
jgi:hypothetical protein